MSTMYDNITGRSPIATDDLGYIGTGKKASQILAEGTTDYNDLTNKPTINNIELKGNKTSSDLGLQSTIDSTHKLSPDNISFTTAQSNALSSGVTSDTVSQVATNTTNISKALTLDVGTALSNGDDLNNYTDIGVYYAADINIARSILHSPINATSGFAFRLEVSKNNADNRYYQKLYEAIPDTGITNTYIRSYTYQGWTAWQQIATTNDVSAYKQAAWATSANTAITITGLDTTSNASCLLLCTDRRTSDADDAVYMINVYQTTVRITKLAGTNTPTVSISNGVVTVSGLRDYLSITVLSAKALTIANA